MAIVDRSDQLAPSQGEVMASTSTPVHPRPEEIINSLTTIVSKSEDELVFVTCVDSDGYAGDSEAFASKDQPKVSLPPEMLFSLPEEQGVSTVMVTSRAAQPLERIADSDLEFTRNLIDAARTQGIEVLDHILVRDGKHKGMRATTDLWD
jgi:hypothetical protein